MAKTEKRNIGDLGEGVACRYLEQKGFEIIERNYWRPWGELDIVALHEKLHFIEVKTVTREPGQGSFRPEENMHRNKILRLHRAIQTYVSQAKYSTLDWQLDLACVYLNLDTRRARIEIIETIAL